MEPRLYFENLSYDGIGDFIASAVEKSESAPCTSWANPPLASDIGCSLSAVYYEFNRGGYWHTDENLIDH